jgi:NADPH-dependent curcumin reductase CurA
VSVTIRGRRVALAKRPEGPLSLDCFRVEDADVGAPETGQVLVETECLSVDAFIRTVLYESAFHDPVPLGETISAVGVGRVLESADPGFAAGDAVSGMLGARTHALVPSWMLRKVDETLAPLRAWLGVLGLTSGVTAYFGVREVGAVAKGETVVVSAAAGAVGSLAAQMARIEGARVIGIAGGPEKCRFLLEDLRLDGAVDYKAGDVAAALRALAPDGIDVYFDNVGGELLDVALDQIRERARVVICGAISQYDHMDRVRGPSLYLRLAERHARMEGYAVTHFTDRFGEAVRWLAEQRQRGLLHLHEDVEQGIERFPNAVLRMFSGAHLGKLLVVP